MKQSNDDMKEARSSLASLSSELETIRIANVTLTDTINSNNDTINNLKTKITTLNNANDENDRIISSYRDKEKTLHNDIKDLGTTYYYYYYYYAIILLLLPLILVPLEILKNDYEVKLMSMTSNFEKEEEKTRYYLCY